MSRTAKCDIVQLRHSRVRARGAMAAGAVPPEGDARAGPSSGPSQLRRDGENQHNQLHFRQRSCIIALWHYSPFWDPETMQMGMCGLIKLTFLLLIGEFSVHRGFYLITMAPPYTLHL